MVHPSYLLLYVDNPRASAAFYMELLKAEPVEVSDTFALFVLENGVKLGFWSRHTVEPSPAASGGGVEICMRLDTVVDVDAAHADWAAKGVTILQPPTQMDFGYCFTAADPDAHRLRVFAPSQS